jgi:hypothetical protein
VSAAKKPNLTHFPATVNTYRTNLFQQIHKTAVLQGILIEINFKTTLQNHLQAACNNNLNQAKTH